VSVTADPSGATSAAGAGAGPADAGAGPAGAGSADPGLVPPHSWAILA
jgi:hypothetical protein